VIRLAPFIEHCQLPTLKDRKGQAVHVLSHDQLEAVLMRRAGFEVRVLPLEDESYEENPPNLLDFVRRDSRWCAGNMQYFHFLSLPGLQTTSRVQLVLAILMFFSGPAWLVGTAAMVALLSGTSEVSAVLSLGYLWLALGALWVMILTPKLVSAMTALLQSSQRKAFGGGFRFVFGVLIETLFSIVISPVLWLSQALSMLALLFGKRASWTAQNRDESSLGWGAASRVFGLHTAIGLLLAWPLAMTHPQALPLLALFIGGLWVVIPIAVFSARPAVGEFMSRQGWLALPDEVQPCDFIKSLSLAESQSPPIADIARATFDSRS
jgi:membrane glycosyltransferase